MRSRSSLRPINSVTNTGRLVGTASTERSGGKRPSPTWYTRCGADRSRSRWVPRSTSRTSGGSRDAVAADTRIWPPWPSAINRAVWLTGVPK